MTSRSIKQLRDAVKFTPQEMQHELSEMSRITEMLDELMRSHRSLVADLDAHELTVLVYAFKNFILASNTKLLAESLAANAGFMKYPPDIPSLMRMHQNTQKMDRRIIARNLLRTQLQKMIEIDSADALTVCAEMLKDC
jgi:hypothetical protein